jgi:aminoglycoside phosphotransferase (APT) family kinase protein
MLSPADKSLVSRDPALPGLSALLDPEAFAGLLKSALGVVSVDVPRPFYVRYKPGRRCLVAYEVSSSCDTLTVHAVAHTPARGGRLSAKARSRIPGPAERSHSIVEDVAVVVNVFPADEALPGIRRLMDPAIRVHVLGKMLPRHPALWTAEPLRLAYKPGRRYVAALRGDGGELAVLKAYTSEGYERMSYPGRSIYSSGPLRVASRLGRSRRHHLVVREWLPGESLADLINAGSADITALRRTGAALATLHAEKRRGPNIDWSAVEISCLPAVAAGIADICPWLSERADTLATDIARRLSEQRPPERPIHGDFHPGQVVLSAETTGIVDFDRASRGDPCIDVGNFLAHLECDLLERRIDRNTAVTLSEALIEGYEEASGRRIRDGAGLYLAAGLLRLSQRPFRTRDPDWPGLTEAILGRAEVLLCAAPTAIPSLDVRPAPLVVDPSRVGADDKLSIPKCALDANYMKSRLSALPFSAGSQVDVRGIRICRHKPARRCLVEYEISMRAGTGDVRAAVIGKVKARGADAQTFRLTDALWRNGFDEASADGVSVPEPLGLLPDLKMWLQRKAPGAVLSTLLGRRETRALGGRTAEAIHKLHVAEVAPVREHRLEDELRILRDRLSAVAALLPHIGARIGMVIDACERLCALLRPTPRKGIHRDFHPGQVLVDNGRLYLLDMDMHALGDPCLDAGNLLAHVTEQSLRTLGNPYGLDWFETAMAERFLSLNPIASLQSIEVYKTLALARHIQISTLFADRRPFTERILELCEERLGLRRG